MSPCLYGQQQSPYEEAPTIIFFRKRDFGYRPSSLISELASEVASEPIGPPLYGQERDHSEEAPTCIFSRKRALGYMLSSLVSEIEVSSLVM